MARWPFAGRWWGIFNNEGDDGVPIALFPSEEEAESSLRKRQALDDEDDDWLPDYYGIYYCDIAGAWWNSFDPDPKVPLEPDEIAALFAEE